MRRINYAMIVDSRYARYNAAASHFSISQCVEKQHQHQRQHTSSPGEKVPEFKGLFTVAGLFVVAYLLRRMK